MPFMDTKDLNNLLFYNKWTLNVYLFLNNIINVNFKYNNNQNFETGEMLVDTLNDYYEENKSKRVNFTNNKRVHPDNQII